MAEDLDNQTIADDNPFRNSGRPRTKAPQNVVALTYEFAKEAPRIKDVAARFRVTLGVFQKWMGENPNIEIAFDRAKTELAQEVLKKQKKQALGGDNAAMKNYLTAHRPDLVKPENEISVNLNQTNIAVLPAPIPVGEYRTRVIEGTLVERVKQDPTNPLSGLSDRIRAKHTAQLIEPDD